jgi:hypothetical protein
MSLNRPEKGQLPKKMCLCGMFRSLGGVRSIGRRLARCSCVCSGRRRRFSGTRRDFAVAVVARGASAFKANRRNFSGAWIADISCVAFVVVAVRKPALVLAVFLMHVSKFTSFF